MGSSIRSLLPRKWNPTQDAQGASPPPKLHGPYGFTVFGSDGWGRKWAPRPEADTRINALEGVKDSLDLRTPLERNAVAV